MIKAILFDAGGVYMRGSASDFVSKACKLLGLSKTHLEGAAFDPDLNKGATSHEECFKKYFGVEISDEQMEKIKGIWTNTWSPAPQMVGLIKSLKKNYTVAVLSNSDSLNSNNYRKKGWYDIFDHLILSHELGIVKPDTRIYEIALAKVGCKPQECLFVDDQKACLDAASKLGMQTILFVSADQTRTEMAKKDLLGL